MVGLIPLLAAIQAEAEVGTREWGIAAHDPEAALAALHLLR